VSFLHTAIPEIHALHPLVAQQHMLDVRLMLLLDEAHREAFLARPKFQVHRRREAVRGGKLIKPTLARSVPDRSIKTWPGTNRLRRVCKWDIHSELEDLVTASSKEDLVTASTTEDSDEEGDGEEARDDSKRPGQRSFHSHDGWQNKGEREMGRARRTKSEGARRRPLS
jgi:hypothetical protein